MNYDKLKLKVAELLAADDKLSDQAIADALNAKTETKLVSVSSAELLAWSAGNGRFAKIEKAETNENPAIASLAKAARYLIIRDGTDLDLNLPDRAAMLAGLVAAGVLDKADSDSVYALATVAQSPAEVLWLPTVTITDVEIARGTRPLVQQEPSHG